MSNAAAEAKLIAAFVVVPQNKEELAVRHKLLRKNNKQFMNELPVILIDTGR